MSKKKKPYFPNNWEAIHSAPDEYFVPVPYEQFMDWKIDGWELPSSIAAVIREEIAETGKIKEYVYRRSSAAKKKAREIMGRGSVFTVCNGVDIHYLKPEDPLEDYDDPLN